jgi:hypothetical protein
MLTFKHGIYSIATGTAQVCFNGVTVSIYIDSNIFDITEKIHYRRLGNEQR